MKCRKCGFENLDSFKFCGECGASLSSENNLDRVDANETIQTRPNPQKSIKKSGLVLGTVVLAIIAIVASYTAYNKKKSHRIDTL